MRTCRVHGFSDNAWIMAELDELRVAVAHHWFASMRGGEKVAAAIAAMFPDAPLFALMVNPGVLPPDLARRPLTTSFIQTLARCSGSHRHWLALFGRAAASLDATAYDLVLCSDAATIKGIRTRPDAIKVCYCHSPMRYIWEQTDDYARHTGAAGRLMLRLCAERLRRWDHAAAQSVTAFIANSQHVAERIKRCYGREATVIHPPVAVDFPPAVERPDDYYLVVGEQVEYKRNDLAVEACARLGRPLIVIGDGPMLPRLRTMYAGAGSTIRFLGRQPDEVVREHYRRCRALLFCGQEDFGIVPVEAMAAGRPVLAYGRGGAVETVVPGKTGLFFEDQRAESVIAAIEAFEAREGQFNAVSIQQHAQRFSYERFDGELIAYLETLVRKGHDA